MNTLIRLRRIAALTSLLTLMSFMLSSCGSSSSDRDLSPIANAGINQTVNEQTTVTLSGSGTAMEGTIDSINWSQTGGTVVTIPATSTALASFTFVSPTITTQEVLTFQITVTDSNGRTDSDTVNITLLPVNAVPTADAGADQTANGGDTVTLSGSGTDSDGTIASYSWSQTTGQTVTLSNADTANASFVAPQFEAITDLTFTLTVTDNEAATDTDSAIISVGSDFALADGIAGGQLYSKFWADETGFTLSNSNLQNQAELDAITGSSNFFRCKQCHGWDRLGRDGGYSDRAPKTSRPNVADFDLATFSQTSTIEELFNGLKTGTATRRDVTTDLSGYDPAVDPTIGDQMPDYSQIFTDDQLWDLVKYLKSDAIDTTMVYDITLEAGTVYPNRARTFSNIGTDGDAVTGDALYTSICANCHGDDGAAFLVDGASRTVGDHMRNKPYEDQHKIKFGHLGSSMTRDVVMAYNPLSDIKGLMKALTDETKYPTRMPSNGINGGRMYSKFWAEETGFTLANSNLQSQTELDSITGNSNFFRCKQCHGWDRLGREGGYSNRAPKTSRPNVADLDLAAASLNLSDQELFDAIKTGSATRRDISTDLSTYDPAVDPTIGDQMPDYSQIFTDEQIWELVDYLQDEALDTTMLYDVTLETGTVYPNRARSFSNIGLDGDAANGDAIFAANCAGCHGDDGTTILVDGATYTVGAHTRLKPYEDQHKVKFGHLGSSMGAILSTRPLNDIKDLLKALADTTKYPDVQVLNGINGGRMYSKFWATETGFSLANSNLQSQAELDAISGSSNFFRCKQCHGWDRLGRDGGYSNRAPKTSRPNVADFDLASFAATSTEQQIFDAIKTGTATRRDISTDLSTYDPAVDPTIGDQMPNYGQIMTDPQIWQMVSYLKDEALDTTLLYDITLDGGTYPTRGRVFSNLGPGGDPVNGASVYSSKCASCHGADGTAFLVDGGAYTVGAHTRAKPYEDQHKVKFGHLGSSMGPILSNSDFTDIVDLLNALSNSTAFPDAAPVAVDGAALFVAQCGTCHSGNGMGTGSTSMNGNTSAAGITTAIATVGAMSGLSTLTVEEIQAIADALAP
jgi:mono/diheme cytochrome c family protein